MTNSDFRPGDKVRLNSGGPLMTVSAIDGSEVLTIWFDKLKKIEGRFSIATVSHDDGGARIIPLQY